METYSKGFKARQVQRILGPEGISAMALSRELGVSQTSLSRWVRAASNVGGMAKKKRDGSAASSKRWTPEEKLRVLSAASQLSDDDLGAFLRSEGLHEATLKEWRDLATAALGPSKPTNSKKKSADAKRLVALEKELLRKEKALAELAALVTLQKKVQAIWGDEEGNTNTRNET